MARRAKHKGLLLLLIVLPFWISYLMRMFAWINLLADDGYAARMLAFFQIDTLFRTLGLLDEGAGWLDGQAITVVLALVYGYVPFLILPVYASVDRIDQRVIEAARDLGASPFKAFVRVTLPLSMPGILGGLVLIALPMFGDYYTPDLISSSPSTNMIGNQIDLAIHRGSEKPLGAALTVVLSLLLVILMALLPAADPQRRKGDPGMKAWITNPWGKPRFLVVVDVAVHRLVDRARSSSRSCSRSTTAAPAPRGRASRRAGSTTIRSAPSGRTTRCAARCGTRSSWRSSRC